MKRALFLAEGSENLVPGETVLWQGRPLIGGLARHLFHIRAVMGYFAVLAVWSLASAHEDGFRANAALIATAWIVVPGLAAAAAVLYAMSWMIVATTHYTITDRRVIMQMGVALPIALTLPLRQIGSADVKLNTDGSGDISLSLGDQKLAYLLIWPHARPWRLGQGAADAAGDPRVCAMSRPVLSRALVADVTRQRSDRDRAGSYARTGSASRPPRDIPIRRAGAIPKEKGHERRSSRNPKCRRASSCSRARLMVFVVAIAGIGADQPQQPRHPAADDGGRQSRSRFQGYAERRRRGLRCRLRRAHIYTVVPTTGGFLRGVSCADWSATIAAWTGRRTRHFA